MSLYQLAEQGLSQELVTVLQNDMGITTLTAVQAGVISTCLKAAKGANGFPLLPNFHISTGIGKHTTTQCYRYKAIDHRRIWEEFGARHSDRR